MSSDFLDHAEVGPIVVPRARYSDDEKAAALVFCRLHAPDYAAASAGCEAAGMGAVPPETLRAWHQKGRGIHPSAVQTSQTYARVTVEALEAIAAAALGVAGRSLEHVTKALDKADDAGVQIPADKALEMAERASRVASTMIEKAQLLGGKPTNITEERQLSLLALIMPRPPTPDADPL